MKILTCILTYNSESVFQDCINSLKKTTLNDGYMDILVIDNNSSDSTQEIIKKTKGIKFIINDKNIGYSGGNNMGIDYALKRGYTHVLILNPDTKINSSTVQEMVNTMKSHPKCKIVGPKIYFEKGYEFHNEKYKKEDLGRVIWFAGGYVDWNNVFTVHMGVDTIDNGEFNKDIKVDTTTGACMLIDSTLFKEIGLLDERYFLYFEESDFCQKAIKNNYEIWFSSNAIAFHKNAQSTGVGSVLQDYYITRNRLLFGITWAPLKSKISLFKQALFLLTSGRKWQKRGVVDFLLMKFNRGSYI